MSIIIDTEAVGPTERFSYWSDALRDAATYPYPYRIQRHENAPFWGRLTSYQLGAVQVARVSAAPFVIIRDPLPTSGLDGGCISFIMQLRGQYEVTQCGRTASLRAGDLTCYEGGIPYTIRALSPYDIVVYRVPLQLLGRGADLVRHSTARRVDGDAGVGILAGRFLGELARTLERGEIDQQDCTLSTVILDLVTALYRPAAHPDSRTARHSSDVLLAEIKHYIEAHLHERDLSVDRIAAGHFISVRLLYQMFQRDGWGVAEWIRHQRLERCCQDLCSPLYADRTVGEIATRWSFTNAAHFSRLFRATYGCSPREFREAGHLPVQLVDRLRTTV